MACPLLRRAAIKVQNYTQTIRAMSSHALRAVHNFTQSADTRVSARKRVNGTFDLSAHQTSVEITGMVEKYRKRRQTNAATNRALLVWV